MSDLVKEAEYLLWVATSPEWEASEKTSGYFESETVDLARRLEPLVRDWLATRETVRDEREACAKIAEEQLAIPARHKTAGEEIAAAIRNRTS